MPRISGSSPRGNPRLDDKSLSQFFEGRAARLPDLGPTRAAIYQDKDPDLAERRDAAERQLLTPRLQLDGSERVLDVGCGTGRWAKTLADEVAWYHGIDMTAGFIEHASREYAARDNCVFTRGVADGFDLESLDEHMPFDRVLCCGLLMYLSDPEFDACLRAISGVLNKQALVLVREPVAQSSERLTLSDFYSTELEANYSAIYRTREELTTGLERALTPNNMKLVGHGYMYEDNSMNNRSETRQEWFTMGTS